MPFGNGNFSCCLASYHIFMCFTVFSGTSMILKTPVNSKTACKMGSYFNLKAHCLKEGWLGILLEL